MKIEKGKKARTLLREVALLRAMGPILYAFSPIFDGLGKVLARRNKCVSDRRGIPTILRLRAASCWVDSLLKGVVDAATNQGAESKEKNYLLSASRDGSLAGEWNKIPVRSHPRSHGMRRLRLNGKETAGVSIRVVSIAAT
jgi:hypothetical protein